MCDIKGSKTDQRVGWKVLAKKDGKYYSTFSGQEISVGKVPPPLKRLKRLSNHWSTQLDYKDLDETTFYSSLFAGKTSAFLDKINAHWLFKQINQELITDTYEIVIVKITFSGDVYDGWYSGGYIIAGDMILSIDET